MPTKTKKASAKKAVAKKKAPAKAKKLKAKTVEPVTPVEKIIHRFEKRFVFVPSCSNCDHVPMRINRLVAMMTVLVAVLSGMVIAQSQSVDLTQLLLVLAQT